MPDQVIIDLLKNANSGQAEDQFRLAQYYDTGDKTRKIKQDTKKAFKWFTKAADQGDQRAILAVSKCYQEGIGVPSSPLLAAKFLYQIIDRDLEQQKNLCNLVCKLLRRENQEARSFLVSIYSEDWKIPDDLCQLAEHALQISSEKPEYYSRAHYQLGKLYSGHFPGIKHNLSQAVAHYQQAADLDHREALYWLAQGHLGLLKLPLKASLNQPLGEDYLQKIVAINPGDNLAAEAFYQLGILQDKGGSGVGISSPQQLKYYQQAADLNHPQALERLADCYLNGSDVIPQDLQLAADYLGKRALLEPESIEYLKKSSDLFSRNVPDQQPSEPYLHAVLKICPQNPEANFLIWKKNVKIILK